MANEIKAYAIQLRAAETVSNIKQFKELVDKTGSLGVHPAFPFAYVMYRSKNEQGKAYEEFGKVYDYCKVVENACYIPDPKED